MQHHVPDREEIAGLLGSLAATSSSPARRRRVGAAAIAALVVLLSAAGVGIAWRVERHAGELELFEAVEVLRDDHDPAHRRTAVETVRRRVAEAIALVRREIESDDPMLREHARNALLRIVEAAQR